MNPFMKAIQGMTMITLAILCLIGGFLALVFIVASFKDNSLYRFCGGLGITWVTFCVGRAMKAWLDDSGDW